jgi:hypothetical protein
MRTTWTRALLAIAVLGGCGGAGAPGKSSGGAGAGGGSGASATGTGGAAGAAGASTTKTGGTGGGAAGSGVGGGVDAGIAGSDGAADAIGPADAKDADDRWTDSGDASEAPAPIISAGCGMLVSGVDSPTKWSQHNIDLPAGSVDPAFIAAHPPNNGTQFNWLHRNYFLKLPSLYDPNKSYPVTIAAPSCGANETIGAGGENAVPVGTQSEAIEVSLSYVVSSSATPDCVGMFADDYPNSPEPAYIHAVIADVEAHFCADASRIFVNGSIEGSFLAMLAGCTNTDEIRAYGVQTGGGLRLKRPACKAHPVAAMYVVATGDNWYPLQGFMPPQLDHIGLVASRDDILQRNGCVGSDTTPWNAAYPKCVSFTGCPTKYPVVWCELDAHRASVNFTGLDAITLENERQKGLWDFYNSLPLP